MLGREMETPYGVQRPVMVSSCSDEHPLELVLARLVCWADVSPSNGHVPVRLTAPDIVRVTLKIEMAGSGGLAPGWTISELVTGWDHGK